MQTVSFKDMTWPSDEFMKADTTSPAIEGIEFINCACSETINNAIRIYKNTYIHNSSLGYLCFNKPDEELTFMADLMKIVVVRSVVHRIEAGIDTFLEVATGTDDENSYIDEIEICGRAVLDHVVSSRIDVERCGIVKIHPSTKIETLIVAGTAIIGTNEIEEIILRPGGKIVPYQAFDKPLHITCHQDRSIYTSADGYICG